MKCLLNLIFFIPGLAFGQSFSYPVFFGHLADATDLVKPHWEIKDSVRGDLNGDHLDDLVLIMQYSDTVRESRGKDKWNTGKPRILLVYYQDEIGYRKVTQHNTFILRQGEGGMVDDPGFAAGDGSYWCD